MFVCAFIFPVLYNAVWYLFFIVLTFLAIDILILFVTKNGIEATRTAPEKLSNGDENQISISIKNYYNFSIFTKVIDEIPYQFQIRNFEIKRKVKTASQDDFNYNLRPTERGEYFFGTLNVYVSSPLKLVARRYRFAQDEMVPTYPSYIQLRKYDLIAFSNNLFHYGVKKFAELVTQWSLNK